jgi:protease-4
VPVTAARKPARPRRRWPLILFLVLLLGMLGGVAVLLLVGLQYVRQSAASADPLSGLELYTVEEGKGPDRILQLRVDGGISGEKGCGPRVMGLLRHLREKGLPGNVKGLLLHVSSPGGAITPCDIIDSQIDRLRQERGIKVVAFYDDLAASGGYYVSARSDHIVARPTSLVGSIGVISLSLNAEKLLEDKLGVKVRTIKSVPFKDAGSPLRPMKEQERAYFQKIIDEMHLRFRRVVKEGRKLTDEEVDRFADGRVFLAEEALKLKMIDEVGHRGAAVAAIRRLVGSQAPIVGYRRRPSPFELMLQSRSQSLIPAETRLNLEIASRNPACYLWMH